MKENNFPQELTPLLKGEKVNYSHKLIPYKAPKVILIFLCAILVLAGDMVFLGVGMVYALFNQFKGIAIALFLVKIAIDIFLFTFWFASVKEKADKAKYTRIYCTDNNIFVVSYRSGEANFIQYEKSRVIIKTKESLLQKFCGVFSVVISAEDIKNTYHLESGDYKEILIKNLNLQNNEN